MYMHLYDAMAILQQSTSIYYQYCNHSIVSKSFQNSLVKWNKYDTQLTMPL